MAKTRTITTAEGTHYWSIDEQDNNSTEGD